MAVTDRMFISFLIWADVGYLRMAERGDTNAAFLCIASFAIGSGVWCLLDISSKKDN